MKSSQQGFTLLELMVTITIVGIIAVIALWDSSDLLEKDRAESYLQELKRNISFARAKATSSDSLVVVCAGSTTNIENNSRVTCSNNWQEGTVFVFYDANQNGVYNPAQNDKILRVMKELPTSSRLQFSGGSSLIFDTSGMITTTAGAFIYCPSKADGDNNKELTVFKSGTALYNGNTTKSCN